MKSKTIQRIAFTFTIILLLQEFSSARYLNRPLRLKEIQERQRRSLGDDVEESSALQTKSHSRKRRGLAAVLLGTAIFVSLANIAFDVYLQIEGCCGLYKDACTYMENFKTSQKNIETAQKETDATWVLAERKYNWIIYSNTKNNELWVEVKRIMDLTQQIVEVLNPNVVQALVVKNNEIKSAVESGNTTVLTWTAAQINADFNSLFDTQLGTIQHLSGVIGNVAELILAKAYGWYKKFQIRNMLRTTYGQQLANSNDKTLRFFGASDVDDLVSQTATSRYNYDIATTRGAKILSFASGVMSLVQIGVEIFIAILKVQQCKNTRDEIKKAYDAIKPQEANMTAVKQQVTEYYSNITTLYDNVKSQVTSDEFLDYLGQIKNMTDDAGLTNASTSITSFTSGIISADEEATYNYQKDLVTSLSGVEFIYDCLLRKAKTIANCESRCQSGSDTLENIFNNVVKNLGTNSGECTNTAGLEFTTYNHIKNYIDSTAAGKGYQSDCVLNNVDKQNSACALKCDGHTVDSAATMMGLSITQMTSLFSLCPTECPPSPNEITTICNLKGYGMDAATISGIVGHTQATVKKAIADNCP